MEEGEGEVIISGSLSISPVHDKKDHINDESFAELVLQSKQRYNEILQANDSSGEGFHDDRRSTDQIEDWVNTKLEAASLDDSIISHHVLNEHSSLSVDGDSDYEDRKRKHLASNKLILEGSYDDVIAELDRREAEKRQDTTLESVNEIITRELGNMNLDNDNIDVDQRRSEQTEGERMSLAESKTRWARMLAEGVSPGKKNNYKPKSFNTPPSTKGKSNSSKGVNDKKDKPLVATVDPDTELNIRIKVREEKIKKRSEEVSDYHKLTALRAARHRKELREKEKEKEEEREREEKEKKELYEKKKQDFKKKELVFMKESIRKRNEVLGLPTKMKKKSTGGESSELSPTRNGFISIRMDQHNTLSPHATTNSTKVNDHSYKLGHQNPQQKEALERIMLRKKKERQIELERNAEDVRKKNEAKDELDQKAEALKKKTEERLAQHRAARALKEKELKEKELEEAKKKQERLDNHLATEKQRLKAIRDETKQRLMNKEAEKNRKAKHEERMIRLKLRLKAEESAGMVSMQSSDHFHLSKPRWVAKRDNMEDASSSPTSSLSPIRDSVSANSPLRKSKSMSPSRKINNYGGMISKSPTNGSPQNNNSNAVNKLTPNSRRRRNTIDPLDEGYIEQQRLLLRGKTDFSNSSKAIKVSEKNNVIKLKKLVSDKNHDSNVSGNVSVSSVSSSGTASKLSLSGKIPINRKIEQMLKSKGYTPSGMKNYSSDEVFLQDDLGMDIDDDNDESSQEYFQDKEKNKRFIEFKRKELEEQRKKDNASLEAKIAKHRAIMEESKQLIALTESRKSDTINPSSPSMIYAKPANIILEREKRTTQGLNDTQRMDKRSDDENRVEGNIQRNVNITVNDTFNNSNNVVTLNAVVSEKINDLSTNIEDLNNEDIMKEIHSKLDPLLGAAC